MFGNPVLYRELALRLRLRKLNLAGKIGLGVIIVTILGVIYSTIFNALLQSADWNAGKASWSFCTVILYILICIIAPIVAANAITSEKEQQTWEGLATTLLNAHEIVLGKLIGRMTTLYILVFFFAPIALFSWGYMLLMGTTQEPFVLVVELVLTYATVFSTILFFTTIGLFLSWHLRRTLTAVVLSYTICIGFLIIVNFLVSQKLISLMNSSNFEQFPMNWINPVYLISSSLSIRESNLENINYIVFGNAFYIITSLLMIWRMCIGFRRFSYGE